MKKVFKFVKGKRDEKKENGGITPSQSGDLTSPAQTPEDERFLGLDSSSGYIVDFCGKDKSLTKLHKAAWQGSLDKLKSALKKIEIDAVDRHNRSALHFAVVQGHPNIVWFLLGNNAKMTICDDDGRTPLLKAVECAHKECMSLLLERGADVNTTDYSGSTGLHIAAKQGCLDMASALLQRNADFGMANNNGEYPIHIATRSQNKDLVELLLRCGASVNVFDRENRTPLMLAAKTGNLILAQLFFEYGAQLTVVDSNGWTAEDYAMLGGHQNVVTELKTLLKKSGAKTDGPVLETHNEEDESDAARSAENSGTWNDSQVSDEAERKDSLTKKLHQFFKKCSEERIDVEDKEKEEELQESPGSGVVPPPCQPPRSWDIIQAGMIDENVAGGEPKRRSIMALGTLHSRRESFSESLVNTQTDAPRYTLSLNRRRDAKKGEAFAKQRLSFNEEESLKSWIKEDSVSQQEQRTAAEARRSEPMPIKAADGESDWDSDLSLSLNSASKSDAKDKRDSLEARIAKLGKSDEGTLGKEDTMRGSEEMWVTNARKDSSWDSEVSQGEVFPPPPSELELGVDIAKSMSYIKGVSIDHPPGSMLERNVWKDAHESQSHSLDCLDEGEKSSLTHLDKFGDKRPPGKRHSRHKSISNQKWRSEELPQCPRPVDRLVDVNRRINEQLECYDQALRELAESSYAKRQDALISTLTSSSSNTQNYYSLPASNYKGSLSVSKRRAAGQLTACNEVRLESSRGPHFTSSGNFYSDKAPFGPKPFIEVASGPYSLPFFVNTMDDSEQAGAKGEVENNETLGGETAGGVAPREGSLVPAEVDNFESLDPSAAKGDPKSKRQMLLAMRDVKHAVQVTASFRSSLDDQILSPLTKTDNNFDMDDKKLSPKAASSSSEGTSPGEETPFFRTDRVGPLGRQETVIERVEFRRRSSSSGTGEEPTLWLQDVNDKSCLVEGGGKNRPDSFSPLGAVYREIQAEKSGHVAGSSASSSPAEDSSSSPTSDKGEETPSAAPHHRLHRLESNSSAGSTPHKSDGGGEEEDRDAPRDQSPDISLSSGPIEPLGAAGDSGSDAESTHNDVTPTHNYSLKNHYEWLKDHLRLATQEKNQLADKSAELTEKAERLQYELADAREAARSRDEVISLLEGQLARMEAAYTKSLEESVRSRLRLTSHEQEILHLKELCYRYEGERDKMSDDTCTELKSHVKVLLEEKDKMKKDISRLEEEKRGLEGRLEELAELVQGRPGWKERYDEPADTPSIHSDQSEELKVESANLQVKLADVLHQNRDLELKVKELSDELGRMRHWSSTNEEFTHLVLELNQKNSLLESRIAQLQSQLQDKDFCVIKKDSTKEVSAKKGEELKEIVLELRSQLANVEAQSKAVTKSVADIQNREKQEFDILRQENLNLRKEILQVKDVPNFKVELHDLVTENSSIRGQNTELRGQVQALTETLTNEREELSEYKLKNATLEQNLRKLSIDDKQNVNVARSSKKREVGKEDKLAWTNLYGIKQVGKREDAYKVGKQDSEEGEGDDPGLQEAGRPPEEEERGNLSLQQSREVLDLKQKMMMLQERVVEETAVRYALENRIAEISLDLKDKQKLEVEINSIRRRLKRDYVPKSELELLKYREELNATKKRCEASDGNSEEYKKKCEQLAREREKAEALRRKGKARPEEGSTRRAAEPRAGLGSQRRVCSPVTAAAARDAPLGLTLDMITQLDQQLDLSIRHHLGE